MIRACWSPLARGADDPWSRNLRILLTAIFLEEVGWSLTGPFLPIYIRELGILDPAKAALWAGIVLAAATAVNSPMITVWAALADRFGRKLILLRALVALAVSNLATGLVRTVFQMLIVRLVAAFFTGLVPLSYAIIASGAPQARVAQSIASLQTVTIAAASLGPLIGGILADRVGVRPCYFYASALCVGGFLLVLCRFQNPDRAENPPAAASQQWSFRAAVRALLPLAAVLFLVQVIDRTFQPILPIYAETLGAAALGGVGFWSGLIVSLAGAAMAVSANLAARLSRRYAPAALLLSALVAGAGLCAPTSRLGSVWQLLVLRTALSLAVGGAPTLLFTLGSLMGVGRGSIGKSAVLVMGQQMGNSLGPLMGGAVAQWSVRGLFVVNALLYLATFFFTKRVVRWRLRAEKP